MKKLKHTIETDCLQAGMQLIFQEWKMLDPTCYPDHTTEWEWGLLWERAGALEKHVISFLRSFYFEYNAQLFRQQKEAVHLMDYSQARGRDFKIVFITGMEEGNWPCYAGSLEQEYRLFSLVLSRAREQVILTSCQSRDGKPCTPSSFLTGLGLYPLRTRPETEAQTAVYNQEELV